MSEGGKPRTVDVPVTPPEALRGVAQLAEAWGGGWEAEGVSGGKLVLPVMAGLWRGWVGGPLTVEKSGEGTRVTFQEEESSYRLDIPAVVTLIIAGAGAFTTVIAPFIPRLLALVPVGLFLALGAWLFIVARLKNSGPEEFFADLESEFDVEESPDRE